MKTAIANSFKVRSLIPIMLATMPLASFADYKVTALQSVEGGSNVISAINASGTIAGDSFITDSNKAVMWDGTGAVRELSPGSPFESTADDINDNGQILLFGPAIWQNGVITPLYTTAIAPLTGFAGLNNSGQYTSTGYFQINGIYQRHAFLVTSGATMDLGTLPGTTTSWSNNINNNGDVVGYSVVSGTQTRAVLWRNGAIIDLGVLSGQSSSIANDINDNGRVVGTSGGRLFTWENGVMTDLGVISSGATMAARGINRNGDIVGSFKPSGSAASLPFIWSNGKFTDLSALVNSCEAIDINDNGQIVSNCNYSGYGYLLSPAAAAVDVSISGSSSIGSPIVNTPFTYTFTIKNVGSLNGTNVSFKDALPTSVSFQSVTSSQGSCSGGSMVTCSLGSLAAGAAATVQVTVVPTATGGLYNSASVSVTETENNTFNNTATVSSNVVAATADMSATMQASATSVKRNANVTYTIGVRNSGPAVATAVNLTDTLPSGMQYVSASTTQGSCSGTTTVTCSLGTMASGASATVSIVTQAKSTGTFTNKASVTSAVTDANVANNTAGVAVTVK